MSNWKMKVIAPVVAVAATCALAVSANAQGGPPQPIITMNGGGCETREPAPLHTVYLYEHWRWEGTCWTVTMPPGVRYAEVRWVGAVGIWNDAITSASVGPLTFLRIFEHASHPFPAPFVAGANRDMNNLHNPWSWLDEDNWGVDAPVASFNDRMSAFFIETSDG
jgi:hypothetical protein